MAGPLLWLALQAGAGSGCLWPQDDQLFSELPRQANRPPRIVPSLPIKPQLDSSFLPTKDGNPCPLPFQFNVEDPDISDQIRTRWFVYAPGATRSVSFTGDLVSPGLTAIRPKTVTAPPALGRTGSDLVQNGEHRVEVVIADNEFVGPDVETLPFTRPLPDGGTVEDKSYTDSYIWIITTKDNLGDCQ